MPTVDKDGIVVAPPKYPLLFMLALLARIYLSVGSTTTVAASRSEIFSFLAIAPSKLRCVVTDGRVVAKLMLFKLNSPRIPEAKKINTRLAAHIRQVVSAGRGASACR